MKFAAAVAALAGVAAAGNVTYTTEVVTALTTYCPYATSLTHNGKTYTITEATTLTITDCPCTVTKPITTTSTVVCTTSGYSNSTTSVAAPTGGYTPTTTPASLPTAGAGKAVALSGAGLAGVLGLAAFVL
jgi:hypothetical protein